MKIYPPPEGYTAEEMRKGLWSLNADVVCEDCKKVQSVAQVGGLGGKCIKCGGKTS